MISTHFISDNLQATDIIAQVLPVQSPTDKTLEASVALELATLLGRHHDQEQLGRIIAGLPLLQQILQVSGELDHPSRSAARPASGSCR